MKDNKGITIVALIITIIVLLIFAGMILQAIDYDIFGTAENTVDNANDKMRKDERTEEKIQDSWNSEPGTSVKTPSVSAPNKPKLIEGMIPVKWNGTNWVKADESKTDWYEYGTTTETKRWANAVTVKETDGTVLRADYMSAPENTVINDADILGMYVWIPRYSYKIVRGYHQSNTGTSEIDSGFVDIQFINGTGNGINNIGYNSLTTDNYTHFPNGYVLHPAFTFGNVELPGFWVAKFEASSSNTTSSNPNTGNKYGASSANVTPAIGGDEVTVRPNVTSWRYITVINCYIASVNMTKTGNIHGLSTMADSHLMKDTEWGAVAYLTQSVYGNAQTSATSGVWNNSYYNGDGRYGTRTGMVGETRDDATSSSITSEDLAAKSFYTYETTNGIKGSTTGTIYGIYDMSGGAFEYQASYLDNVTGQTNDIQEKIDYFKTEVPAKHKIAYGGTRKNENLTENGVTANGRYFNYLDNKAEYGNALYETSNLSTVGEASSGWNGNYSNFLFAGYPFVMRSGRYDSSIEWRDVFFQSTWRRCICNNRLPPSPSSLNIRQIFSRSLGTGFFDRRFVQ